MTDSIAGLPFWDIVFDADGDPDPAARDALRSEVPAQGITDLYVFTHGWNNERATARRLYNAFFGLLAQQLAANPAGKPGLAGVYWPSKRWSDEQIPDFTAAPVAPGGGVASAVPRAESAVVPQTIDPQTLADLLETFPDGKAPLERMATLLATPPTEATLEEFRASLREFAALAGTADDDGESEHGVPPEQPRMLQDPATDLFERYRDALRRTGAELPSGADGTAGIGDKLHGILNGAKEALRGATYWEMKNRAGMVGRKGLGPLLGLLAAAAPGVRVHLIGHSFGARLVSYALDGLPAGVTIVKSVTLLQGAFSHFAFTEPLPFDAGRKGTIAGRQSRVDGPVTVCFSRFDNAVGRFYPLASLAARDDSAAGHPALWRWGGMGADGAQNADVTLDGVQPAGPGAHYRFAKGRILNVDCQDVVRRGDAPSGAHSDIVHPELTWIVLAASRA